MMISSQSLRHRSGQSLMDILVGSAVGVILIFAAVGAIAPALKTNTQAVNTQASSWLASGLLSNAQAWANNDWHNILPPTIATGTTHQYYLITSSSPYLATSGIESVIVSTTTYTRYFYVSDVYRDSSGNITTSGGTLDPSTKQITVVYKWTNGPTSTASEYVTRNTSKVFSQNDWTGGASSSAVTQTPTFQFASSTNVDITSTPGSIKVQTL